MSPEPAGSDFTRNAGRVLELVWVNARSLTSQIAGMTLLVALLPAAIAYISQLVVDGVVQAIGSGAIEDRNTAIVWVCVETALIAAYMAGSRILDFLKTRLHAELGFVVNRQILSKALTLTLTQMETPDIQQRMVLARQFAANRPYSLINRLLTAAQNTLMLTSVAVLLWTFSPLLVLLVIAGGLPLFAGNLYFSGSAFRFYTGRTPQMRERSYLESLMTADGLARERLHHQTGPAILKRYEHLFGDLYSGDRKLQARKTMAGTVLGLFSSAIFLGGKIWIVVETIAAAITLGQMTMLIGLLKQGQNGVTALLAAFNGIVDDLLYVSNLYTLLELPDERSRGVVQQGAEPGDGLRLKEVGFTYPGQNRPALTAVNLHIPPGTQVGIVGANGSGKTTLIKLLTGLYLPDSGSITLDGTALEDWKPSALSQRLGVLFQPFNRYKLTARDNISAGAGLADLPDETLIAAAKSGMADAVLEDMPHGLDSRLSKRFSDGLELSGGQWQRLAMARAYLNDRADILILDEPTAAMDPMAESQFVAQPADGRTRILISHRLSNIRHSDLILVFDRGRLVEHGTHEDLLAAQGLYAGMFDTQAETYRQT